MPYHTVHVRLLTRIDVYFNMDCFMAMIQQNSFKLIAWSTPEIIDRFLLRFFWTFFYEITAFTDLQYLVNNQNLNGHLLESSLVTFNLLTETENLYRLHHVLDFELELTQPYKLVRWWLSFAYKLIINSCSGNISFKVEISNTCLSLPGLDI